MSNTQKYRTLSDGTVYSDPANPDYLVRFKTTSNPKSLDGNRTNNYITEVIVTDLNDVTIGGNSAVDAVSVRVRVSGSIESMDRLKAILGSVAGQLPIWSAENVLEGFEPSTPPLVVI